MIVINSATLEDIHYALEVNRRIEGDHAGLTAGRLNRDLFDKDPKVFLLVAKKQAQAIGLCLYTTTYFASEGPILWVSQLFIEPAYRQGPVLLAFFRKIRHEAKLRNCDYVLWGTQKSSVEANRVWEKWSGSNLSESFNFWVKKIS